ncbi:MAG: NADPH:quinone oxidoreductase family protein [Acidimicrobiales bacterium]
MRAWRATGAGDPCDVLRLIELAEPEPEPGTVRVAVAGADVNFADILQVQGRYQVRLDPPFVPGMSASGRITAVGAGVDLAVGQMVVGPTVPPWGGFAEAAILAADQLTVIPGEVDPVTAAGAHVTFGTAWYALHDRGGVQAGETVLVLAAAGGVGSAAVQLATDAGCWVLGAAGGPAKTAAVESLGAGVAVDYLAGPDELYDTVMALTDGRGVDVVVDPVGGTSFDVARRLVAWNGRLLVVGFAGGDIRPAPTNHLLVKNYSVVGVHLGGARRFEPDAVADLYRQVYARLGPGGIEPLITGRPTLEEVPDALRRLADRDTIGRLVVVPTDLLAMAGKGGAS